MNNEFMNSWIDKLLNEKINKWINNWINEWTRGWINVYCDDSDKLQIMYTELWLELLELHQNKHFY